MMIILPGISDCPGWQRQWFSGGLRSGGWSRVSLGHRSGHWSVASIHWCSSVSCLLLQSLSYDVGNTILVNLEIYIYV